MRRFVIILAVTAGLAGAVAVTLAVPHATAPTRSHPTAQTTTDADTTDHARDRLNALSGHQSQAEIASVLAKGALGVPVSLLVDSTNGSTLAAFVNSSH